MTTADRDRYNHWLSWSAEDGEHVATCAEFPSLSWLAEDETKALRGIKKLVREAVEDSRASGESVPEPLAKKDFSGRFVAASRRSSTAPWPRARRRRACP